MSLTDFFATQVGGRQGQGRTPIYRVMLNGESLDVTVSEASLTLGENMHDTGAMTVSSTDRKDVGGILGSPISFLYGNAPRTEVFCGYVTAVTQEENASALTWTMEVIGPTRTMQAGTPRFWTHRTIPSAVEALSNLGYLGYSGHTHPYAWPSLAQVGDSDWKTAVSFARRLGWNVYNRYGIVGLYDPMQLFQSNGPAFTLISESHVIARTEMDQERSLLSLDPSEDAEGSLDQQGVKVAYFNDTTVQVAEQRGEHSNYRFTPDYVIRNAEEAMLLVNGADSDTLSWPQQAKARILGNSGIFPGMSVNVHTTNPKYYTGKFNGRWLVRGVQHKMDRQNFQSNLMLARPSGIQQVFTGGYVPFWQVATKPRPVLVLSQVVQMPGSTTPNTGVWMSSWTNPTVRDVA